MNRKFVVISTLILIVASFAGCLRDEGGNGDQPPGGNGGNGGSGNGGGGGPDQFDHPMQDPQVRVALSYAFPYDTAREEVYHGYMSPLPGPIPNGMPFADTQNQIYQPDLDQATQILDDAGWTAENGARFGGEPLRIYYNSGNTQREQNAQLFRQNLQQIGINAEVQGLPWPQFLERMFQTRDWDIMFLGWAPDYNDPDNYWFPFAGSAQIEGYPDLKADVYNTGYSNQELDEILLQAKFEPDEQTRADLYRQAHEIYMQEPSLIFIGQNQAVNVYREWLQGFEYNPMSSDPGYFYDFSKSGDAQNPNRFVYATFGDPASLDPADAYDTASGLVIQNVYDTLVRYEGGDTETLQPRLATDWESNEDGTEWTFNLRQGVQFADGSEMTADDVVYSFQRVLRLEAPETGVHWILAQSLNETGIEKVDDYTVRFNLEQPYAGFLPTLAYTVASVISQDYCEANGGMPQSADEVEDGQERDLGCAEHLSENPMGTNAYQLDRWDRESEVVLTQNPNYWEGWDGNHIQRAVIRNIEEPSTRNNALLNGEVDFAEVDLDKIEEVEGQPGVVVEAEDSFTITVGVLQTHPEGEGTS